MSCCKWRFAVCCCQVLFGSLIITLSFLTSNYVTSSLLSREIPYWCGLPVLFSGLLCFLYQLCITKPNFWLFTLIKVITFFVCFLSAFCSIVGAYYTGYRALDISYYSECLVCGEDTLLCEPYEGQSNKPLVNCLCLKEIVSPKLNSFSFTKSVTNEDWVSFNNGPKFRSAGVYTEVPEGGQFFGCEMGVRHTLKICLALESSFCFMAAFFCFVFSALIYKDRYYIDEVEFDSFGDFRPDTVTTPVLTSPDGRSDEEPRFFYRDGRWLEDNYIKDRLIPEETVPVPPHSTPLIVSNGAANSTNRSLLAYKTNTNKQISPFGGNKYRVSPIGISPVCSDTYWSNKLVYESICHKSYCNDSYNCYNDVLFRTAELLYRVESKTSSSDLSLTLHNDQQCMLGNSQSYNRLLYCNVSNQKLCNGATMSKSHVVDAGHHYVINNSNNTSLVYNSPKFKGQNCDTLKGICFNLPNNSGAFIVNVNKEFWV